MSNGIDDVRAYAIRVSRSFKAWLAGAIIPRRWLYRWLFMGENGDMRRVGEHVLADLRDYAKLDQVEIFHVEPTVQAYRLGKQAVVRRIIFMLNLDDAKVRNLVEIDDE